MVYTRDCTCEEFCNDCTVEFTIDVHCDTETTRAVTTADMQTSNKLVYPAIGKQDTDEHYDQHDQILIVKMRKGQSLKLTAHGTAFKKSKHFVENLFFSPKNWTENLNKNICWKLRQRGKN